MLKINNRSTVTQRASKFKCTKQTSSEMVTETSERSSLGGILAHLCPLQVTLRTTLCSPAVQQGVLKGTTRRICQQLFENTPCENRSRQIWTESSSHVVRYEFRLAASQRPQNETQHSAIVLHTRKKIKILTEGFLQQVLCILVV